MRDIIAIAKVAFLKTHGGIELNPDKFCKAWIECFSGMLEAEIRKEFEVSIQFWKDDSAAAWDKCEERRQENVALTAQNANLQDIANAYERDIEKAVTESVKAGIGEHSPEAAIATLAYQRDEAMEQNAKSMEALEVILDSSLLVGSTELHDKVLKQTYSAIHSNITPQPENREGE